ncbi:MAG: outer membrane protein assembly factor BamD [Phycisphaeraceae bacterium]
MSLELLVLQYSARNNDLSVSGAKVMRPVGPGRRKASVPTWGAFVPAWLVAGLMVVALAVGGALGQETYQLGEGQEWRKTQAPEPGSPEAEIQTIRKAVAEERYEHAKELANRWIEQHPNHPMLVEAYLLRGDARVGEGIYYKALFDYELVLRQYPASEQFTTALEREFEIARLYSLGKKRKFLGMPILSAYTESEELLIRIQERAPGSEIGERASLFLGDHYARRGQMERAAIAYEMFLRNYPDSLHREPAMLRLIQSNLAIFKGPRFDATGLLEAAERIKLYRREFPAAAEKLGAEALLTRIDESLARKQYLSGQWYEARGERVSAAVVYQRVVQDHAQTAAAQAAIERLKALGEPVVAPPVQREDRGLEDNRLPETRPAATEPVEAREAVEPAPMGEDVE